VENGFPLHCVCGGQDFRYKVALSWENVKTSYNSFVKGLIVRAWGRFNNYLSSFLMLLLQDFRPFFLK